MFLCNGAIVLEDRKVGHLDLYLDLFSACAWSGISGWEVGLFGSHGSWGLVLVLVLHELLHEVKALRHELASFVLDLSVLF